jgi:O-antigen/teichoic acid export membrane protein
VSSVPDARSTADTQSPAAQVLTPPPAAKARVRGADSAFSDITSVSAARVVTIFLTLASTTLVAHLLKPAQYSILAYITVLSGLMFTASASWTSATVTRYGREELEARGSLRHTSWNRMLITTPLAAVIALAVIALKPLGLLSTELTWAILWIVIGTGLVSIATEHVTNLLEACGRMKLTALCIVAGRLVSIGGIIVLAVLGVAHSASTIALLWLVLGAGVCAAMAVAVWHVGFARPVLDRVLLRRMLGFSLPLIAFSISQYVIQAVDIVILGHYRTPRDVGLYALAYSGYAALQAIPTTATIVLSPLFVSLRAASHEHVVERFYRRLVPQALLLASVGAGLAAPLLHVVVPIVFGRHFAATAAPLTLLLGAWMLYSAASFVAPILVLHERARAMGLINAAAAVVNVTADWLLIGVFGVGIAGPAIATGLALLVIAGGYFYVAACCIGVRTAMPLAALAPGVVGMGVAVLAPGGVGVASAIAGTMVVAAAVTRCRGLLSSEDADLVVKLNVPDRVRTLLMAVLARLP